MFLLVAALATKVFIGNLLAMVTISVRDSRGWAIIKYAINEPRSTTKKLTMHLVHVHPNQCHVTAMCVCVTMHEMHASVGS